MNEQIHVVSRVFAVMDDVSASYDVNDAWHYVTTDVMPFAYRPPRVDALYVRMRSVINILLPIIFGAGVAGNALNAVLLTRRRGGASSTDDGVRHGRPTTFERSAMVGLVALSASDFLFCLVGFSEVLFVGTLRAGSWRTMARLYYDVYHAALMNLFLFSSTWLIALVSVERCLAVCCPFRAGALIRVRRTAAAHVVVFVASAALNVPLFLKSTVVTVAVPCVDAGRVDRGDVNLTVATTPGGAVTAVVANDDDGAAACVAQYFNMRRPTSLIVSNSGFFYVHKVIWFAVGTFLPLLLIVYSNVRLIREICRMRRKSSAATLRSSLSGGAASKVPLDHLDRDRSSTVTLTLTLIAIGVCFLLLVCPSMAVQFYRFANYSSFGGEERAPYPGRAEAIAIMLTNLTQAVKFASNFLLYCVVSRSFRRTFSKLFWTRRCAAAVRGGACPNNDERSRPEQRACNAALIDLPLADNNIDDTGDGD